MTQAQTAIISECNEMLGCINNLSNYLDKLNKCIDVHSPYEWVIDIVGSIYDYYPDMLVEILYNGIERKLEITKQNLNNKLPYLQQILEDKHEMS